MSTLSNNEAEFVLGLVHRIGTPEKTDRKLEAIGSADPDWHTIINLVSQHRLHTPLYRTINDIDITIPPELDRALDARYNESTLRNLDHSRQLYELIDLFGDQNIPVLPYKGPVLAEVAHDSVGGRSFGDLDFLIEKKDAVAACELLEKNGYERLNFADVSVEELLNGTPFRWGKEFRFMSPDAHLPVEIRFGFIGGNGSDSAIIEDFWTRRTTVRLAGRSVSTLSPEDRALLLLAHGTKHGWRQLSWVYDVGQIFDQDIDWDLVLSRSKEYSWLNAVLYGLAVTAELTGQSVPDAVEAQIDSAWLCSFGATRTVARLRNDTGGDLEYLEPITTTMFLNDSLYGVLTDGLNGLFAPRKRDYHWMPLPPQMHHVYYIIRPLRLLADTIKRFTVR